MSLATVLAGGLVLPAALTFTVPARNAVSANDSRPGSVVCRPVEATIWRHRQSAAWVAMHPAMQLDGGVWAATMPAVRREAAPVVYARIPLDPNTDAGRRIKFTVTDTSSVTWFYFVTVRSEADSVSEQSNEVGKP